MDNAGTGAAGIPSGSRHDEIGWRTGLLDAVMRIVVEAALEAELDLHLRVPPRSPAPSAPSAPSGPGGRNARNGTRRKTVRTEFGRIAIDAPRDRWGTFDPLAVGKWQRRVNGLDRLVLPLAARGSDPLETRQLLAHAYGAQSSPVMRAVVAAEIARQMAPWHDRTLAPEQHVLVLHRVGLRSRDGRLLTAPIWTAVGVSENGDRELLALHASAAGARGGSDGWDAVLADLAERGVHGIGTVHREDGPGVLPPAADVRSGRRQTPSSPALTA